MSVDTKRSWRASAAFDRGPSKTATDPFAFNALPDSILLGWLAARGHRPNVLIECSASSADTAIRHLMTWCAPPFRYCAVPGRLELPTNRTGTLLLKDVAELTRSQQVSLSDWLTVGSDDVQVISVTTAPLVTRVEDGDFLEGLFYRLNVIRLDAVEGTRPAPPERWQQTHESTT